MFLSGGINLSKRLGVVFLGAQKYVFFHEGKKLERRACKRPKNRKTKPISNRRCIISEDENCICFVFSDVAGKARVFTYPQIMQT